MQSNNDNKMLSVTLADLKEITIGGQFQTPSCDYCGDDLNPTDASCWHPGRSTIESDYKYDCFADLTGKIVCQSCSDALLPAGIAWIAKTSIVNVVDVILTLSNCTKR